MNVPWKVVSLYKKYVLVRCGNREKRVIHKIPVKKGDRVLVQSNIIIEKIKNDKR